MKTPGQSYDDLLLPDGARVSVALARVETGSLFQRSKWWGWFVVTDPGPHLGKVLIRPWNAPTAVGRRPGRSHRLWTDCVSITGLRPPIVTSLKDPGTYVGTFLSEVEVLARTVVVRTRMDPTTGKWKETPHGIWYSRIDGSEDVVSGTPLMLRRPDPDGRAS